jgi:hypothetical protein
MFSSIAGVFYFQGFPERQMMIVETTALLYFLWGMTVHYLEGDLHIKIVVEYLLIASLVVIIFRGAILR